MVRIGGRQGEPLTRLDGGCIFGPDWEWSAVGVDLAEERTKHRAGCRSVGALSHSLFGTAQVRPTRFV